MSACPARRALNWEGDISHIEASTSHGRSIPQFPPPPGSIISGPSPFHRIFPRPFHCRGGDRGSAALGPFPTESSPLPCPKRKSQPRQNTASTRCSCHLSPVQPGRWFSCELRHRPLFSRDLPAPVWACKCWPRKEQVWQWLILCAMRAWRMATIFPRTNKYWLPMLPASRNLCARVRQGGYHDARRRPSSPVRPSTSAREPGSHPPQSNPANMADLCPWYRTHGSLIG